MKKFVFILVALTIFLGCKKEQSKEIQQKQQPQEEMLIGLISRADFLNPPYNEWFKDEYEKYEVDKNKLPQIKNPNDYNFVIVMGTWCPDSRREVPRFYKIIDQMGVYPQNIKMYAVDRNFKAGKWDVSKFDIERIPTFIVFYQGKELGRIIEKPKKSLEEDLNEIFNAKK